MEPLEPRLPLAAAGLVEVGSQPSGGLDGKIVYVHGGHGYIADNLGSGSWTTQRPLLLNMVEDMGNKDQMDFFVDYLFDAGATVVPLRPVGHQSNEVILDNDDPGVTFTGAWSNSSSSIYFGDAGDVPYRFASTSATETATASYRPNIPEAGYYPVYTWARSGSDRVDQLYRVHHAGGATEVTVNHRRVGNGTVYLGTYYFEAGTDGYVEVSNRSGESGVVIADMIRFGNGVGDISRGGGVSGFDREDESTLYWIQWHVDHSQGVSNSEYRTSSDDRNATVGAAPRYSEYMNREQDGSLSDRLFISFHSNAGGGGARGVLGLHNTASGGATPNQLFLATTLGRSVNDDLVAQNGQYEHDWNDRGASVTYQASFNYGEINNSVIQGEFDATIVETAFHDNQFDAELMRDSKVRDAIARATYQGVVDYFNSVDGGATANIDAPGKAGELRVVTTGAGAVKLDWKAPEVNSYNGGAPTGYVVYASTNGYGFDGGRLVAGGATTTTTIFGLDPDTTYYFQVVARNAGGQSPGSEVVAAAPIGASEKVLIVNGFDRLDRSLNPKQTFIQGGLLDRVRPLQSNSFDYSVQMASAIHAAAPALTIDTAANEAIISGQVSLSDYDAVFWILGEESSADSTFDAAEQAATQAYLSGGGSLFVSGSEIGWDLDNLNNGKAFYNDSLRATYLADDAGTYQVQGATGSIFAGMSFAFDDGSQFYNAEFPDVISPFGGAQAALNYGNGAGAAAVQYNDGQQKLVMLAFPFETITSAANRSAVMTKVLEYFDIDGDSVPSITIDRVLDNDDGPGVYTDTGGWLTSSDPGYNGGSFRFNLIGTTATAQWQTDLPLAGTAEVFVQYAAGANRATGAAFEIEASGQTISKSINQQTSGLQWVSLGSLSVDAGPLLVRLDAAASTGAQFSLVLADAVRVVLTAPAIPSGDYNQDGFVDAADYSVWRDQVGESVTPGTNGDGNFDGQVDQADYQLWREQYGTAAPLSAPLATLSAPVIPAPLAPPSGGGRGFENRPAWDGCAFRPGPCR